MKKNIIFFCVALTIFSLTAFGFMKHKNQETKQDVVPKIKKITLNNDTTSTVNKKKAFNLIYNVDSRYIATITKEKLNKATSILDIIPKEAKNWWDTSFQTVTVSVIQEGNDIHETGNNKVLNVAQIKLLNTTDYSTNFYINARGNNIQFDTGRVENYAYYFTITPEKEATYINGHNVLINYLKENSKEKTDIIKGDKLKPGKVNFTVSKTGLIKSIKLSSTSGYPSIDKLLIELITKIPGEWEPAENYKGEKVDQEFTFFFGLMGC